MSPIKKGAKDKKPAPLGRYIVTARKRVGWSRAMLARTSEVPYTTLRNLEKSPQDVHTDEKNLRAIANSLGDSDQDKQHMYDHMRALAGYLSTKTGDVTEQDRRFLASLNSYPHLRRALETLLSRGDNAAIDRAFTAIEVSQNLGEH